MRTGPTNPQLKSLIQGLKEKSLKEKSPLWERIARDLSKPARARRAVNLSRISRCTEKDELIIVPGKVLASGELNHPLTIVAWQFSDQAIEKIKNAKCHALRIEELMKQEIKGKAVRIIG